MLHLKSPLVSTKTEHHDVVMRYLFILVVSLISCATNDQIDERLIARTCREIEQRCDPGCIGGTLRDCYVDTTLFPEAPYDPFKHCHALHVGNHCAPCTHIFSVNFGGAMRDVGCEEFHRAIERKNRQCGGCLKTVE